MPSEDTYRLQHMHAIDPPEKAWKQFAPLFDLTPLKMANNAGAIENHSWFAGPCIYAQVSLDGNAHKHTDQHLSQSGDLLFVHRYLAGGADGRSGELPYMMRPGRMIFHDYGRPFEGIQTPSLIQSVHIPHRLIGYDPDTMPPQIMLDPASAQGAALAVAFEALMRDLLGGLERLQKDRASALTALVRDALPEPGAAPSLQMQIQSYIEDELVDPDFTLDRVLAEFNLSRAQLFDALAVYGGFENYLSVRRTYRALFDLVEHQGYRVRLDQTALNWGFPSEDAFKRAVAQHYNTDLETVF